MKKNFSKTLVLCTALLATVFTGCKQTNTPTDPTHNPHEDGGLVADDNLLYNDNTIGNGDDEFVFTGKQTLRRGTYLLKGWVYVADGAELTIEPGTIIKGDKETKAALIVERGGKLFAQGTPDAPIVFTSEMPKGQRRPGDWGGLILCGRANNNQTEQQIEGGPRSKHGGNDNEDNSGILSYVRVEFAGYPFQTDKEINGITFGSVGSKTQIDHLQVSYSNDDSYEWFGGTVNCKYLVAFRGWDDDFDTDNGFSGAVQFGLAIRDSRIADVSQSNGFESDNCADGAAVSPYTSCVFSNITFVGPKLDPQFQNNADYNTGGDMFPNNGSSLGRFQAGMQIRRNSHLNCFNSLIIGWPIGVMIDNEKGNCWKAADDHLINLQNVWMADYDIIGSDMNKQYKDSLALDYKAKTFDPSAAHSFSTTWFLAQPGNSATTLAALAMESNAYIPTATSPVLTAASFTPSATSTTQAAANTTSGQAAEFPDHIRTALASMEQVPFIGAFPAAASDATNATATSSGASWLSGWTNFDPQNTDY